MAKQAQDTFTASPDGIPYLVQRGQVYPDNHPVVVLDAGRDLLFKSLDLDQPPPSGKPPAVAKMPRQTGPVQYDGPPPKTGKGA